jgi:HEAT repeat protein
VPSLYTLEKDEDHDQLISLLRKSDNPKIRKRAAEIIGEIESHAEATDALVGAVKEDDESAVRAAAIDALSNLEAIEALLRALGKEVGGESAGWAKAENFMGDLQSDEPEMRMAAANVLGQLGKAPAARPVAQQLEREHDHRVRARLARALGRIGEPSAAGVLVGCLQDEPQPIRREAADALGHLGGDTALQGLLQLVDDESESMRRTTASSLGRFENEKPVDALVGLLQDPSDLVRRAAVFSLIEILSNVPPERSHELRETIVDRMSATDDRSVVASLVEIIEEGMQTHQRRNATWMLGRVAGENSRALATEALVSALADDDDLVSQFAATSLQEIGGRSVESALLQVLSESTNDDAIAMAAFALGKVGGDRARERLKRLVDDTENDEIRRRAFSSLSKLGTHSGA